jgi:uncharacterized protein (DUF1330 family)
MPGYVIADVTVTDPDTYAGYRALTPGTIEAFEGRFLIRGGEHQTIEGSWTPDRLVLLGFDSLERANGWYDSDDYVKARAIRQDASTGRLLVADGLQEASGGVYVIAFVTVTDPAKFADYPSLVAPSIAAHGGRILVQGVAPDVKEGSCPGERVIVLEFDDRAAALGWYESEEYRPAKELRAQSARFDAVLADGA